jgi:hypothetical protein
MKTIVVTLASVLLLAGVEAQTVTFDFDSGPYHASLPIDQFAGGITAHFSATGQGFSVQPANALGFTPVGFSGYCIYPNSVFSADLMIAFDAPLNAVSLLYAPEEYATDSSCTMLISAYLGSTLVGTNTATIDPPGTWPSGTLSFTTTNKFDNVVIHYYKPPVTGGDYGPIFMADNLVVTPVPPPPTLEIGGTAGQIVLVWPTNAVGFSLQSNTNLANSSGWISVTNQPVMVDITYTVSLPATNSIMFYRLKQP